MKVTIRKRPDGTLTAYIAKKDLEETILPAGATPLWGACVTLANGWRLELPALAVETPLPVTVEARRLPDGS
ncbi:MAG: putative nitrogen fixation protein NifT [Gammaproteobacteria bacterium]|nr:putative nitrogen fixation protein NifT [Gammaproteobacteria bacterium]